MDSNRWVCSVFIPAASRKRRVPGWTCTSTQMFHFRCWMGTAVWALKRSAITPGACAVTSSSWAACGQSPRTESSTVSFGKQSVSGCCCCPGLHVCAWDGLFPLAFPSFTQEKLYYVFLFTIPSCFPHSDTNVWCWCSEKLCFWLDPMGFFLLWSFVVVLCFEL